MIKNKTGTEIANIAATKKIERILYIKSLLGASK